MDYIKTKERVYRVVGRYMTGSEVNAYHLVANDGSQVVATKDRTVYMIGKGLIENLRVQYNGSHIVVRGKGVNLSKVPVYDEKTQSVRSGGEEKTVKKLGVMMVEKSIRDSGKTIGYEVRDYNGKTLRLPTAKVKELAKQGLISNATTQKYTKDGVTRVILRGHNGTVLSEIPQLLVNENGKIIDPTRDIGDITFRAVKMKRGGTVLNESTGGKQIFGMGDYIVCGIKGELLCVREEDIKKNFKVDTSLKVATCDKDLSVLSNYPIEIFGQQKIVLKENQIRGWAIIKKK